MANLLCGRAWILRQQGFRAQDKSRRAIGTLKSVVIHESLLNRVQLAGFAQPLDRDDLFASIVFQSDWIQLPWNILERGDVVIAQVCVEQLAAIAVTHLLEERLPETKNRATLQLQLT